MPLVVNPCMLRLRIFTLVWAHYSHLRENIFHLFVTQEIPQYHRFCILSCQFFGIFNTSYFLISLCYSFLLDQNANILHRLTFRTGILSILIDHVRQLVIFCNTLESCLHLVCVTCTSDLTFP